MGIVGVQQPSIEKGIPSAITASGEGEVRADGGHGRLRGGTPPPKLLDSLAVGTSPEWIRPREDWRSLTHSLMFRVLSHPLTKGL